MCANQTHQRPHTIITRFFSNADSHRHSHIHTNTLRGVHLMKDVTLTLIHTLREVNQKGIFVFFFSSHFYSLLMITTRIHM